MAIAQKVRHAMEQGSWIRRMFEEGARLKARYGPDKVFDLSLGNPILEPPEAFRRLLQEVAHAPSPGMHRYMPNAGFLETRAAVAAYLQRQTGLPFTAEDVVMTCGAGGALNVALKALLDPGDEVIILSPFFPEYPFYADNHGGVVRIVPTDATFQPDPERIRQALTPNTRALILNSPHNPTGVVYTAPVVRAVGEVLRYGEARFGRPLYLISDEPYSKLVYDGVQVPSVFAAHPRTLVATSFSKDLSLPGERIGYLAVHPHCPDKSEVVDACIFANRVLGFVNAPALMQVLVRSLLDVTVDIGWYQKRRDWLYTALTEMGYQVVKPQGAFYLFPRSPIPDDIAFVQRLQEERVLVVPGSGFGTPGHFRIAYCVEEGVIEGALEGFRRVARALALR
ncbi:MAG: pyridoxal phosphate-dependent aminotransferase [Dehalococcoidia bacterium]|nr:pyridoxal phosphate-dependent aminotransferase [Dehalococcoidia bacterium]